VTPASSATLQVNALGHVRNARETTACRSCDGLAATAITGRCVNKPGPNLACMRAVQTTQFGRPEVLEVVDVSEPVPGDDQQLYDLSTAGVNFADTHHPPTD
jgi:hypothetical protein